MHVILATQEAEIRRGTGPEFKLQDREKRKKKRTETRSYSVWISHISYIEHFTKLFNEH
jgi:hypothetical protein